MAISPSYVITRFAKSVFTGPVRPTPGTAIVYTRSRSTDADYGFNLGDFMDRHFPDQKWPSTNPPIDIEIRNLARPAEAGGIDDYLLLVGMNPGVLNDSGSAPRFNPIEVIGRSSPYAMYSGGQARQVKASFKIHRDMFAFYKPFGDKTVSWVNQKKYWESERQKAKEGGYRYLDENNQDVIAQRLAVINQSTLNEQILESYRNTLNWLRALQYPVYANGGVIAPKVYMRIGKFLKVEGYPSVQITYDSIYSEGYPVVASVDVSITETLQRALDQTAIYNSYNRSGGMDVVEWPNK